MELPVVAYAKDSIFTIFVIALPILFNPSTSSNRRSSHDRGNYVRPYFTILFLVIKIHKWKKLLHLSQKYLQKYLTKNINCFI